MKLRYKLIFLISFAIVTVFHSVNYVQWKFFKPRLENMVIYENYYAYDRDPEVTCKFPIFHPFDESILSYIEVTEPIRCYSYSKVLTMMDRDGALRFNKSALLEAGYKNSFPQCYYQEIHRVPGDDFEVVYNLSIPMTGYDRPKSDFIFVSCKNIFGINIYKNFHASVQRHPSVRSFKDDRELGVAVIGLDSMSRLNFMRQLPLSYHFITEALGGVVLLGFNKVGENTFPNVMPMLTGRPCSHTKDTNHYQNWPFIWKQFAAEGAATLYGEDLPGINTFNLKSKSMLEQPTLHYMRPFWLAFESSSMYHHSSFSCMGPTPKHTVYLNYLLSFLRVYKHSPSFLFSILNEPSHNYVNTVGAIDNDLADFLNTSFTEGLFNRTIVLILGDHGNRIDPIRKTDVGRIEDYMPMVSVVMPKWADKAYPGWLKALQKNRNRLMSSFDIHGTFLDVLSTLKKPGSEDVQRFFEFQSLKKTGMNTKWAKHFSGKRVELSFFRPVPVNRTCSDAGIPTSFCVCKLDLVEKLRNDDERSVHAAKAVVSYFNSNVLRGLTQCATQKLAKIHWAVLSSVNQQHVNHFHVQVMFQTQPGGGEFEATVNVSVVNSVKVWQVVSEVRVNKYGSQADCLPTDLLDSSTELRAVCYCV